MPLSLLALLLLLLLEVLLETIVSAGVASVAAGAAARSLEVRGFRPRFFGPAATAAVACVSVCSKTALLLLLAEGVSVAATAAGAAAADEEEEAAAAGIVSCEAGAGAGLLRAAGCDDAAAAVALLPAVDMRWRVSRDPPPLPRCLSGDSSVPPAIAAIAAAIAAGFPALRKEERGKVSSRPSVSWTRKLS